jgi:putative ABC transport system permease protein
MACLAVGVGAIVAVSTQSSSIQQSIRTEARAMLGADISLRSRQGVPDELDEAIAAAPLDVDGAIERTTVREQITLAAAAPRRGQRASSRLVELRVIDGVYPVYGDMQLDPPRPLNELLAADTVVVASSLLEELSLSVGDDLLVGGQRYRIAGTVLLEPDRLSFSMSIGPRIYLSGEGHARASMLGRGLRMQTEVLLRLPEGVGEATVRAVESHLESKMPEQQRVRVTSYLSSQPRLRRSIDRVAQFLGLVGLLSLLIGSVGVAQTVRAWIAERIESIAVMRCLGLRPREAVLLFAGQVVLLAFAGSTLGAALGVAVAVGAPALLAADIVPAGVMRPWQPLAIGQGMVLGVGVALVFSLPPLLDIRRISPALVLRSEAEPLRGSLALRVLLVLVLLATVWGAASWQADSPVIGGIFTAGLLVVVGLLAGCARGMAFIAGRLPRDRGRLWLRHGLARLARPGAGTVSAIVAVGLGVTIVFAVHLVERHLSSLLAVDVPDAPSSFMLNIEPEQWEGVEGLLEEHDAESVRLAPVVMARIRAIDEITSEQLLEPADGGRGEARRPSRWALRRQQRLTYLQDLPEGNEIIAGETNGDSLWSDPEVAEVSVEAEFAEDLGVSVGSTLRVEVDGTEIDFVVTSIRSVNWRTISTNFFLIVEPGVLDDVEQTWIATARLPRGGDQRVQDEVAALYPNITVLQVREMLDRVLTLLQGAAAGVQLLGAFTVIAGVLILAASIGAGYARRGREVALLKTLGMTRLDIVAMFAVEYALIGLVAGLIGGGAGGLLAWGVLTRMMEIEWMHRPITYVVTLLCAVALAVGAGLAASRRAMATPPVEVLRAQ